MIIKKPVILAISVVVVHLPFSDTLAESTTENWLQLQRLNQNTLQQLNRLQQHNSAQPTSPLLPAVRDRQRLNAQQQSQLLRLQESQRRQQIIDGHRQRVQPNWPSYSGRLRQQMQRLQYRQAQQSLLQHYGINH
jgi:hypothetical protein